VAPRSNRWICWWALVFLVGTGDGCSLVSGWSDVTGGSRPDGVDAGAAATDGSVASMDAGRDAGSKGDAATRTEDSGGNASHALGCRGAICDAGDGCCIDVAGGATCGAAAACGITSSFLECGEPLDCAGNAGAPVCCVHTGLLHSSSRCAAACDANDAPACNPKSPVPCPSGGTCTASALPGYFTCG
jgi:hypothetical protein